MVSWSWVCEPVVTTVLGVWAGGHYGPGHVGQWSLWSWACGLVVTMVLGMWAVCLEHPCEI